MYQSSSSSSSAGASGLPHNGSAPTRLAPARFFPTEEACDSSAMVEEATTNTTIGLRPSYGFCVSPSSFSPSLVRHSSSPAAFINQLAATVSANKNGGGGGFPVTRGRNPKSVCDAGSASTRLSFNRSESLSRISEESDRGSEQLNSDQHGDKYHSHVDAPHPILFPVEQRAKPLSVATSSHLDSMESQSQLQFCISPSTVGMSSMDKLLNIPLDSVPCKIRAKRGCATHPRSIAERERRTRISGKLKKLQDLVPNMDKQTSYADMLDLAVQHIKSLQTQVQKLNKDLEGCSCGSKRSRNL